MGVGASLPDQGTYDETLGRDHIEGTRIATDLKNLPWTVPGAGVVTGVGATAKRFHVATASRREDRGANKRARTEDCDEANVLGMVGRAKRQFL